MTLAVLNCRQVLTLATRDLGIVADGALHIRDGRIVAAGPRARDRARPSPGHRNRRCRRSHRAPRLHRRAHPSGVRGQSRGRVRAPHRRRHLRRNRRRGRGHTLHRAPHPRGVRRRPPGRGPPLRGVVPARRHDHHRSQIGIRPLARLRNQNPHRHPRTRRRRAHALRAHLPGRPRNPR